MKYPKYVLLISSIISMSFAQYTAEWTSPNLGQSGWGAAYAFDIDNDGLVEFETRSSSQFTFYNGNYTVAWNISFPGYDYLNVFRPRDIDGNGILVPLNTDNDGAGELVIAGYYFSGATYYGRFRIYDASSHNQEYESPLITGFYGNGTLEDLDGDGRDEIIIVRFGSSTSESYVVVYAYTTDVKEQQGSYEIRTKFETFPNPSNNTVTVPFSIYETEASKPLEISIYDQTGRLVKILLESNQAAQGDYRLIWNGTDENGGRVSSGSYFVHILKGGEESVNDIKYIR